MEFSASKCCGVSAALQRFCTPSVVKLTLLLLFCSVDCSAKLSHTVNKIHFLILRNVANFRINVAEAAIQRTECDPLINHLELVSV